MAGWEARLLAWEKVLDQVLDREGINWAESIANIGTDS